MIGNWISWKYLQQNELKVQDSYRSFFMVNNNDPTKEHSWSKWNDFATICLIWHL